MQRINFFKILILIIATALSFIRCERVNEDFAGTYCLNLQNMEMIISQTGDLVTFSLNSGLIENGTGSISKDTLVLSATVSGTDTFAAKLVFPKDRQSFSGPYMILNDKGEMQMEGILLGNKGECPEHDIEVTGVPEFVEKDFTQLSKIDKISKFRSGFGHSFTDGSEPCRSMKHYFNPYQSYRQNNAVEIYSPVNGMIVSVANDGHGASAGLTNKEVQIKPDKYPAFVFVIYHCDLTSEAIVTGKRIEAGELIGHARLYYDDLNEYATSFDIAVWVNTPSGMRLVSYFETMSDDLFNTYLLRGVTSRHDFIITKEDRDSSPLQCDGDTFLSEGSIENFVSLN